MEIDTKRQSEIGFVVLAGIIASCVSAFFLTLDGFWLKSYGFDLAHIEQTQFGWMCFFAALGALFLVAAISFWSYLACIIAAPLLGYISKVFLGIWGVLITVSVVYLVLKSFGINVENIGH